MIWQKLLDAINGVIDNVTIQDLIDKHNESNASDDYVI
jgi:DNA-binding IscR family transcriptional regulator